MKTIIIGLGNPILSDDGVGWRVAQEVEHRLRSKGNHGEPVEVDRLSLGGISLMERLAGYDQAILIDAIQTARGAPGTIYRLGLDDLPTFNADAIHDASLKSALQLGRSLGAHLPEEIVIYAIESVQLWDFGERLSPEVESSVLPAAEAVLAEIEKMKRRNHDLT